MPINKNLSSILNIIMIVLLGIICFDICIYLRFIGKAYKNIYASLTMIVISVVIYNHFKNYVKRKEVIKSKYLNPKKMNWKLKVIIIYLGLIFKNTLSQPFPNESANQKKVEESQKGMDIYTALIDGAISPSIIEEICFRGILFIIILASSSFLFNSNKKRFDWLGLITFFAFSSMFFGFVHVAKSYDIQNIGGYVISGVVFSLTFLLTRDLKVPIILHALGNALSILARHDMQFVNYILVFTLLMTCLYSMLRQYKKIEAYGNYIEYRITKKYYEKKLRKDTEIS